MADEIDQSSDNSTESQIAQPQIDWASKLVSETYSTPLSSQNSENSSMQEHGFPSAEGLLSDLGRDNEQGQAPPEAKDKVLVPGGGGIGGGGGGGGIGGQGGEQQPKPTPTSGDTTGDTSAGQPTQRPHPERPAEKPGNDPKSTDGGRPAQPETGPKPREVKEPTMPRNGTPERGQQPRELQPVPVIPVPNKTPERHISQPKPSKE